MKVTIIQSEEVRTDLKTVQMYNNLYTKNKMKKI